MTERKSAAFVGPRLGLDENGLGPRLGPMIVSLARAHVDAQGAARYGRKLPQAIRQDLDDSKQLVSCHDYSLAEAWARGVVKQEMGRELLTPAELVEHLAGPSVVELQGLCPSSSRAQCWSTDGEVFISTDEQRERVASHLRALALRGIVVERVRSEIVCTGKLNALKQQGVHRFSADLHAMERLILREAEAPGPLLEAVCGKVGGIGKYDQFFGPLAGRLHMTLQEGQAKSSYYFPGLGTLHFVRDADASDPLVMLASLVGKYLRELLMGRVARFYRGAVDEDHQTPSGYHDPITAGFVAQTEKLRKKLRVHQDCFERRPAS
ncbi:MAG TPA: hypothetical protein VN764_15765 [Polyangiaceae bacterium]|nr:hypothetical protein [Polyangiaceae bacterium]